MSVNRAWQAYRQGGFRGHGSLGQRRYANWTIPGKMVIDMGGAMDLVAGVKRVADVIITTFCALAWDKLNGRLVLLECAPSVSTQDVIAKTVAPIKVVS